MIDAGDALLRLDGVFTDIGRYRILHGVNLAVRRGHVTALLGRNGAGKTTTLRTIMGLWRARQGRIIFNDQSIVAMETPRIAGLGIAYVPENMGIFGKLTVRENMLLATAPCGFVQQRLDRVLESFPALKLKWQTAAGALSGGQKQMLAIARAMIEQRGCCWWTNRARACRRQWSISWSRRCCGSKASRRPFSWSNKVFRWRKPSATMSR